MPPCYAQIAPAAPHAQHMPSNFHQVGLWDETIAANQAVARTRESRTHAPQQLKGCGRCSEQVPRAGLTWCTAILQEGKRFGGASGPFAQGLALTTVSRACLGHENQFVWPGRPRVPLCSGRLGSSGQFRFPRAARRVALWGSLGATSPGGSLASPARLQPAETYVPSGFASDRGSRRSPSLAALRRHVSWIQLVPRFCLVTRSRQVNSPLGVLMGGGETAGAMREGRQTRPIWNRRVSEHPVTPGELLPERELEGDLLLAARPVRVSQELGTTSGNAEQGAGEATFFFREVCSEW